MKRKRWLVPVLVVLIIAAGGGGFFGGRAYSKSGTTQTTNGQTAQGTGGFGNGA